MRAKRAIATECLVSFGDPVAIFRPFGKQAFDNLDR